MSTDLDSFNKVGPLYTPSIVFTVNDNFYLTRDPYAQGTYPGLFVSLEHTLKCSTLGSFTLDITYIPNKLGHITSGQLSGAGDLGNPNYIENVLCKESAENGGAPCKWKYGYSDCPFSNNKSYYSPVYEGYITDYNISFQEGALNYKITGYSLGSECSLGSSESQSGDENDLPWGRDANKGDDPAEVVHVVDAIKWLLKDMFPGICEKSSASGNWKISFKGNLSESDIPDLSGDSVSISTLNESSQSNNVLTYCQDLLDKAAAELSEGGSYSLYVDSTDAHKVVIAYLPEYNKGKADDPVFTFRWNDATDNNFGVTDFSVDYRGSVALFSSVGADESFQSLTNTSGVISNKRGSESGISGDDEYYSTNNSSVWDSRTAYPYRASLTSLGHPQIYPQDIVRLNPLFGPNPHHARGTYQVISLTHSINKENYSTSYNLVKQFDNF